MLDHHAWKAAHNYLDAAQKIDTTARPVDVTYPHGDALDGTRILPELFAESSPDVCPVMLIKSDAVDSDIRRRQRRSAPARRPLHRPGNLIRERVSLSHVSCADAFA